MSSELNFACSLSNPKIRSVLRPRIEEIDWSSRLALLVIEFFTTNSDLKELHPGEIRSFLSSQDILNEEIDKAMKTMLEYQCLPESKIPATIKSFEGFYYNKKLKSILDENSGDSSLIIETIQSLNKISTDTTPLVRVGDLDVDQVLKEEMGDMIALPSKFNFIQQATPFSGYIRGQVIMVVAPPGTGKSLFLANEAVEMLKKGYKVFWVALGDLMKIDFIIRFTSLITGKPYYEVSVNPKKYFTEDVKKLTQNLRLTTLPAGNIDILELKDFIDNQVAVDDDFDVFVLDYDSNLKKTNESMYMEGDQIYNTVTEIARPEHSKYRVVFVASQPKINYWELEELPKESAGESSRKQAIVDIIVTMGKNQKSKEKHIGILKAAKVRRGKEGIKSCYLIEDHGSLSEITLEAYRTMQTIEA